MPTYQYTCTDCGEPLEAVQRFTDEPLQTCPACGGRLRKVFSAVGVVFKGSGFYKTDSRAAAKSSKPEKLPAGDASAANGAKAAAESQPESKPTAGEQSSTEAKPAKKPAAEASKVA